MAAHPRRIRSATVAAAIVGGAVLAGGAPAIAHDIAVDPAAVEAFVPDPEATPSAELSNADGLIVFTVALRPTGLLPGQRAAGIFAMRPDGSGVRQLTSYDTLGFIYRYHALTLPDDHPSLSPDGRRIVFNSNRDSRGLIGAIFGGNQEIYSMKVNGTGVIRLTNSAGADTEPVYSPNGSKIVFTSQRTGNGDIYVMNANGSGVTRLTTSALPEIEPSWSPDGSKIVFTRVLSGGLLEREEKDIWIMNANGSGQAPVVDIAGEDHDAVFSLTGERLIISSDKAGTRPFGDTWSVDPFTNSGAVQRNVFMVNMTKNVFAGGGDPSVSPDGTKVVFFKSATRLTITNLQIWTVRTDATGAARRANLGVLNVHPDWGVLADADADGVPDYRDTTIP